MYASRKRLSSSSMFIKYLRNLFFCAKHTFYSTLKLLKITMINTKNANDVGLVSEWKYGLKLCIFIYRTFTF